MLQVEQLHQYYGGSHILRGLSFDVKVGEVTCLLGRNGVGKTTLLKCLMGLIPAKEGAVNWEGKAITAFKPHQRVHAGIRSIRGARSIQKNRFFSQLRGERHTADPAELLFSRQQNGAGRGRSGLYVPAGRLGGVSRLGLAPGAAG